MDAAAFLQTSRRLMKQGLEEAGFDALAPVIMAAVDDDYQAVMIKGADDYGEALVAGLQFIRERDPSLAIFSFRVEPCEVNRAPDGKWFDHLVLGTFYERGPPMALRPFTIEWDSAAGRLGWFEWYEHDPEAAEQIRMLTEMSKRAIARES